MEESVYRAKNVIIATGSTVKRISLPGMDNANVIMSDEALSLEDIPPHIVIIGGGVIGVEFA